MRSRLFEALVKASCSAVMMTGLSVAFGAVPAPSPGESNAMDPQDITGYWVSVVSEDWKYRMVTPKKGDVSSIPLNPEGIKAAGAWEVAQDGDCKAYGAAGLMRMPTRLRISWESDTVLKIETDAGIQTRRLIFDTQQVPANDVRTLQGVSVAEWQNAAGVAIKGGKNVARSTMPAGGPVTIQSVTHNMSAGWLRRNGVPYSENATLTEHFDLFDAPNGDRWLTVLSLVDDPVYLRERMLTSSNFKKEPDGSRWDPRPCKTN